MSDLSSLNCQLPVLDEVLRVSVMKLTMSVPSSPNKYFMLFSASIKMSSVLSLTITSVSSHSPQSLVVADLKENTGPCS